MDEITLQDSFSAERAELFEALGHPTRIRTLKLLQDSQMSFSELKKALGIESSGLMQHHLRKLQGLVRMTDESDYAITDEGKEALRVALAMEGGRPGQGKRISLSLSQVAAIIMACCIVAVVGISFMEYSSLQRESSATINSLSALNQSYSQLLSDIDHFNRQVDQTSFLMTPISKSQAIAIALAYGGWNATSLRGLAVVGKLERVAYNNTSGEYEREYVTVPLAEYSKTAEGSMEYWYEWAIVIKIDGLYPIYRALYSVDAVNGQVLSAIIVDKGADMVTMSEDCLSNPDCIALVRVNQSLCISYNSSLVMLFIYDSYANGTISVITPNGPTQAQYIPESLYFYRISYDIFSVDVVIAKRLTGVLFVYCIRSGNTTLFQSSAIIL